MAVRAGAKIRPGWALEPDLDPVDAQLRRRRWRLLRAALPTDRVLESPPSSVTTPDQFVEWLGERLTPAAVKGYFEDLEVIAKQAGDLEILRLVRGYKGER